VGSLSFFFFFFFFLTFHLSFLLDFFYFRPAPRRIRRLQTISSSWRRRAGCHHVLTLSARGRGTAAAKRLARGAGAGPLCWGAFAAEMIARRGLNERISVAARYVVPGYPAKGARLVVCWLCIFMIIVFFFFFFLERHCVRTGFFLLARSFLRTTRTVVKCPIARQPTFNLAHTTPGRAGAYAVSGCWLIAASGKVKATALTEILTLPARRFLLYFVYTQAGMLFCAVFAEATRLAAGVSVTRPCGEKARLFDCIVSPCLSTSRLDLPLVCDD